MLPDIQLLTIPTTLANYKPKDLTPTAKSLVASNLFLLQVGPSSVQEKSESMAQHHHGSNRRQNENELWFTMPSSARRQQEQSYRPEQSAYQATSSRISVGSVNSISASTIPTISTSSDLNKPLPPSPSSSERKKRKSASLRGLLLGEPSSHLDSNHLRPEPYPHNPRYSTSLSLDTNSHYHHTYSRSMPSSPNDYNQPSTAPNPATLPRAHSAAADYPDTVQYQPYSLPSQQQQSTIPVRPQRATSMNTYFETTPTRARTFPEPTALSHTPRENVSNRPRPHTWLSPSEPFTDISQFHLFAEAMTGLPTDLDPLSLNGAPQLQGSLFARRGGNDTIPIPLQSASSAEPARSHQRTDWQNFEPPSFSSRAVSTTSSTLPRPEPYQQWQPPPHMNVINAELEMLGLHDDQVPDEELPDYAQSQAEMNVRRRQEASARARELESRWRGARGI